MATDSYKPPSPEKSATERKKVNHAVSLAPSSSMLEEGGAGAAEEEEGGGAAVVEEEEEGAVENEARSSTIQVAQRRAREAEWAVHRDREERGQTRRGGGNKEGQSRPGT